MVESLGMAVGAEVVVDISGDRSQITITPANDSRTIRGRHRIQDLIAASSPQSFKGGYDWGSPHGKEVW